MTAIDLTLIALWVAYPVALFIGKAWIKASVEKSIQHKFDSQLERLRNDLKGKSDEISTLRNSILGGASQRQALLDKRRIEAVEKLWANIVGLQDFKFFAATLAVINYDVSAKRAVNEPKLREVFEMMGKSTKTTGGPSNEGDKEKPFISPLAWAYFAAYRTIIGFSQARHKVLELGIAEPEKLFDEAYVRGILKAALPEKTNLIDTSNVGSFYYLLDELETKLLAELQKTLAGEESAVESVELATKITSKLNEAVAVQEARQAKVTK